jgi:hypothetical protein
MNADSTQNPVKIPTTYCSTRNPIMAGGVSALVPGAGQIYTGNYVKSGLFITSEVIIGLVAYNRFLLGKYYHENSKALCDSMLVFKNVIDTASITIKNRASSADSIFLDTTNKSLKFQRNYDFSLFQEKENRLFVYQCFASMAGLYYWNILDAIKNTKFFMNDNPKIPSKAAWLAAIPALGLGQLYNGELSKAGFVFTVQMNMAYWIYNNNELMRICENNLKKLPSPDTREGKDDATKQLISSWDSRRNDAFQKRNRWAWYSIGFYLYSILDAYVDAHLHDSMKKMNLEPDLLTGQNGVGLHFTRTF